jgi:hypothetical protein
MRRLKAVIVLLLPTRVNNLLMKDERILKFNVSVPNLQLFLGNIPTSKNNIEIMQECKKKIQVTQRDTTPHFIFP